MHFADFAWDVVELKRGAERLRASERNHRELIEKLPAGVMVVEGGEVLSLNAEGARILGFETSGEALEGGLASMLGEDSVASMERRVLVSARKFRDLKAASEDKEIRDLNPVEGLPRGVQAPELLARDDRLTP